MIVVAFILSGALSSLLFEKGVSLTENVYLSTASVVEVAIILLAAFLSMKTTKKRCVSRISFLGCDSGSGDPLYRNFHYYGTGTAVSGGNNGASLGLQHPWQMFWAAALSSFLDNTPDVSGISRQARWEQPQASLPVWERLPQPLKAISCGAVCMGANTYIGNAPNFMVRSMAEEGGVRMPSFFGYMAWSGSILIPVFFIDMLVFFL